MEARDVILRPVVTEASTAAMDDKRYTFDVNVRGNEDASQERRRRNLRR
jgi:large subunit ribosomal protein L23